MARRLQGPGTGASAVGAAWMLLLLQPGAAWPSLVVNRVIQVRAVFEEAQNCANLRATLNAIQDSSETNRYLVLLEPGNYWCGAELVAVPEGVSLRGLSQHVHIGGKRDNPTIGVVHLFSSSGLESLSVDNTQGGPQTGAIAVSAWTIGDPGVRIILRDVVLSTSFALANRYALWAGNVHLDVYGSDLEAPVLSSAGAIVHIHYSRLHSASTTGGGPPVRCTWSFKLDGTPLGEDCQP